MARAARTQETPPELPTINAPDALTALVDTVAERAALLVLARLKKDPSERLVLEQAAAEAHRSVRTLHRMIARGELRTERAAVGGRITVRRGALEAALKKAGH